MSDVGDSIQAQNARWSFAGNVSKHFDAHAERSIPFYHEGHNLILSLADFFLSDGMTVYDLGCSTGELTKLLVERNADKNVQIIGIDSEESMLEVAARKCAEHANVKFQRSDISEAELEETDLIISYYTMQFVRPRVRQRVFDKIYNALNWGGGFILFEKVRAPDARFQDMMSGIYTDFKIDQGYSETEIVRKSQSLKGVLEPFSSQGNLDLLQRAGFVDCMTVMKYVCFEGFLAIK